MALVLTINSPAGTLAWLASPWGWAEITAARRQWEEPRQEPARPRWAADWGVAGVSSPL